MSTWTSSTKKHAPAGGLKGAPPSRGADVVTPESIRARAYEIFQARRGTAERGDAVSDWLQAERELSRARAEVAKARSPH